MEQPSLPSYIDLKQKGFDLRKLQIGLTWSKGPNGPLLNPFQRFMGEKQTNVDLDLIACLLDKDGYIANLGHTMQRNNRPVPLINSDIIYFHNLSLPDQSIVHSGDNRTGEQLVDDEVITIFPDQLATRFDRIIFMVMIFDGKRHALDFGKVDGAHIELRDIRKNVICRLELSEAPAGSHALTFLELARTASGSWRCQPVHQFHEFDSLAELLRPYVRL
jgi:stress response protein SCP2